MLYVVNSTERTKPSIQDFMPLMTDVAPPPPEVYTDEEKLELLNNAHARLQMLQNN